MQRHPYLYGDVNPCRVHLTDEEARLINVLNLNDWVVDAVSDEIRVNLDLTLYEIEQLDESNLSILSELDFLRWFIDPTTQHTQAVVNLTKQQHRAYKNANHILNNADNLYKPQHHTNLVPRVRPIV